jgi:hypothetical protein
VARTRGRRERRGENPSEYAAWPGSAIDRAVDPSSPDFLNFTRERQPLVDAAFLAQALLRAPRALRDSLDASTRRNLIAALESTRTISPGFNNWLLFSATVEAALARLGATWDRLRVDYALRQHDQWYKGDGMYGDGPSFDWDYYNSFVIHPMLLDVLERAATRCPHGKNCRRVQMTRAAPRRSPERLVRARRDFPGDRTIARVSLWRVPAPGEHGASPCPA